jgi:hypothetical protein
VERKAVDLMQGHAGGLTTKRTKGPKMASAGPTEFTSIFSVPALEFSRRALHILVAAEEPILLLHNK